MTKKIRNVRQQRALSGGVMRRDPNLPIAPEVLGVDFEPYQTWAEQTLGYRFNNPALLVTALTHRSYVNEHRHSVKVHNERLEFLGDAVLELVATDFLFKNYEMPEGVRTAWRSALVRTESIRDAGRALGYAPLVRMSKGEQAGPEHARLHIVANCFEALVGAIYLDQGFERAQQLITKYILINMDSILNDGSWRDPKSYLQEITQRLEGDTPDYRVLNEEGPDHDKTFTVGVFVGGKERGRGSGSSKQNAQQSAAHQAIDYYNKKAVAKNGLSK